MDYLDSFPFLMKDGMLEFRIDVFLEIQQFVQISGQTRSRSVLLQSRGIIRITRWTVWYNQQHNHDVHHPPKNTQNDVALCTGLQVCIYMIYAQYHSNAYSQYDIRLVMQATLVLYIQCHHRATCKGHTSNIACGELLVI